MSHVEPNHVQKPDVLGTLLLLSTGVARAQSPSPETMEAARKLVMTLRLPDQYRALLPGILFSLRPSLTQDRPEIERDFDAHGADGHRHLRQILQCHGRQCRRALCEDFLGRRAARDRGVLSQPGRREVLAKFARRSPSNAGRSARRSSRKATDDLKARMTQALREKGHKF